MENLKKAASGASILFTRAKQFTEEKLGQAERTQYDNEFEALLKKADITKFYTEKIISNAEAVLQPNPNERLEDYLLNKIDKKTSKANNLEYLGHCMCEAGVELGSSTSYGNSLIKVGETEKKLGAFEREFVQRSMDSFLQPLKSFLDGQMKTIQKEKKTLEVRRLDLDACKAKLKKSREERSKNSEILIEKNEEDLRRAQVEFDRQLEITKLLFNELHISHSHHLRCLCDFVDAQSNFYTESLKIMHDLQKQMSTLGVFNLGNQFPNENTKTNQMPLSLNGTNQVQSTSSKQNSTELLVGNLNLNSNPKSIRREQPQQHLQKAFKAKVLFDFQAGDENELSVNSNEVITAHIIPNDNEWVYAERGNEVGKVPKAYIQIAFD